MTLHNEGFRAIIQTNVESITEDLENIGDAESSKVRESRKLSSPALVEQILKLEAFKEIKQYTVSITVTESQMAI